MKTYQKPETVNVNIKESNFLEIVCASLPPAGPGDVDPDQGIGTAPRKVI